MKKAAIVVSLVLMLTSGAFASDVEPKRPSEEDKCPVCGMFVHKYVDFLAQIIFKDGATVFFDGTKDMFKYVFEFKRYAPSRDMSEVAKIYVTDYYGLTPIDGAGAYYVVGSRVHGPMGHELIPFARIEDANEFMFDHSGKEVLPFKGVTPEVIMRLD